MYKSDIKAIPYNTRSKVYYEYIICSIGKEIFFNRYAFVVHHTSEKAERNRRRRINFHLFGPKCRVEYAHGCSSLSNNHQNFGNRKLMVARIPGNVNEDDLHNLFANCHILKYFPARTVHRATTTAETKDKIKIIWG